MSAAPSTVERHAPSALAVAFALGSVYVLWGSTYLGIRFALQSYPPFLLGAARMFLAGVLMYAVLRWRGTPAPTRKQWRTLWLLSIWMVLLSNGLVNLAETQVDSGLAAIAVASMPLFAGVFAMLRGRHPSKIEWVGLAIGFLGVIWLNAGGKLSASTLGLVCLIVAPIAWAWGSIWSRDQDLPSPFMAASAQMLTGSAWMLGAAVVTGERITTMPTFSATAALLYLVVAGSIFGFTAYIWLLHHVRPALATSYAYVNPPIAVLFGALLAGERFTSHDLGAMAVILVGVVIITLAKARAAKAAPAVAAVAPPQAAELEKQA
ncbi:MULTISPECIES: drug/metabolite exporter YedA [unclassified Lysobacter]|uniref:drug/metabolite exporter YedA n=1 Tax=unclassified Lysobacter TaxID=2635362 RepID=UPI001BEA9E35|nr:MULTISPECIES: drug/metabolite exporter YedA [unclassified Lysobacter]MBT2745506.1 drug/metabolite exporter YedA [Lysobacter sp. ISL-42]MBT2753445.1 drug/metabolite exporter YedA [Lysobacter sp. ISL-50]MBT2777171.1 drug/metabolite exporter YedA [Lysobacter sp. ISL-54]MBT2780203.1 drug/metabolite exporter YedA [Lysobacter sp. ISL-52]